MLVDGNRARSRSGLPLKGRLRKEVGPVGARNIMLAEKVAEGQKQKWFESRVSAV